MKTLTPNQEAFVQAYEQIVAEAPEKDVRMYFETSDEEFWESSEHYTSIIDAYLMWEAARRYEAGRAK